VDAGVVDFGGVGAAGPDVDRAPLSVPTPIGSDTSTERVLRRLAVLSLSWATRGCDATVIAMAALLSGTPALAAIVAGAVTWITLEQRLHYRTNLTLSVLEQVPTLIMATLIGGGTASVVGQVAHLPWGPGPVWMGVLAAVGIVLVRSALYSFVRYLRINRYVNYPTLVVGASDIGRHVASILRDHPEHGLRPRSIWDPNPQLDENHLPTELLPVSITLSDAIRATEARVVILSYGNYSERQTVEMLRTCSWMRCDMYLVPRLHEMAIRTSRLDEIWGLPLLRLRRPAYQTHTWVAKRALDITVSAILLLAAAPIILIAALAVRIEGGSGVLFRQERVGTDGHLFQLLKLRSMRPLDEAESATTWNISRDSRVGPVGRILRRTSIDELPQLWNVFRGQMTLVGPRPERPHYVQQFSAQYSHYMHRHRVPAGLTGWAQVHGLRGDTSIEERAQFDNYYIENWSLWGDIKILLLTVAAVIRREGG